MTESSTKPNVILIVLDCVRHDHLGFSKNNKVKTPAIDSIAKEGVVFTNAACHAPFTTPSITSMLSGLYPFNHGVRLLIGQYLPKDIPYASSIFQRAGYRTAGFPSVFLFEKKYGFDRGYDHYNDDMDTVKEGFRGPWRHGSKTTEDILTFLKNYSSRDPFFMFIHYFDGHDYRPGTKGSKHSYLERIQELDSYMDKLIEGLKETNKWNNTMIIITGDHGDEFNFEHGFFGHGKTLYDDVLRIPLIFRYPAMLPSNIKIDQQVRHIDILPTLLSYIGIDHNEKLDGVSLKPAIDGKYMDLKSYAETSPVQLFTGDALDKKNFKGAELISLRTNEYKYIYKTDIFDLEQYSKFLRSKPNRIFKRSKSKGLKTIAKKEELYMLLKDPKETKNIAEKEPEQCKRLHEKLHGLLESKSDNYKLDVGSESDEDIMRERLKSLGYM